LLLLLLVGFGLAGREPESDEWWCLNRMAVRLMALALQLPCSVQRDFGLTHTEGDTLVYQFVRTRYSSRYEFGSLGGFTLFCPCEADLSSRPYLNSVLTFRLPESRRGEMEDILG
jgi:hypothetical protein